MKNRHLVLFDDACPLCQRAVHFLLKKDRHGLLNFAPLQGQTAQRFLKENWESLLRMNSIVLLEDFKGSSPKTWIRSQAVFRSFWLLGDGWRLPGLLSFLPSLILDPCYRLVARHRHRLSRSKVAPLFSKEERKRILR